MLRRHYQLPTDDAACPQVPRLAREHTQLCYLARWRLVPLQTACSPHRAAGRVVTGQAEPVSTGLAFKGRTPMG
jgi:hypothetical protein